LNENFGVVVKTIYLLRHAEAEKRSDIKDIDRSLTSNGELETLSLSKELLSKGFVFDKILCSSSRRTLQTCDLLLKNLDMDLPVIIMQSLYNPFIDNFLDTIRNLPDNCMNILIISHNPTVTEFANYVLGHSKQQLAFDTANMAKLDLSIKSWADIKENCATTSFFL